MAEAKLPPFNTVIKGREVEDPVNLMVHRPLAYAFVALTLRTPLTPNQITVMAMICGFAAAVCWFLGGSVLIPLGGVLLWSSAILDGADGIMARAKKMHSDLGRALDGSADMVVALVTVSAGFYHIWTTYQEPLHALLMPLALVTAVIQIWLYDYYKECFQNSTNPEWDGVTMGRPQVKKRLEKAMADRAPFVTRFAWNSMLGMLGHQHRFVKLTHPSAIREGLRFQVSDETVEVYRKYNRLPMKLWAMISLCPHSYLMAIAAIVNRLDLYMWFRVTVGLGIWAAATVAQHRATRKTMGALEAMAMSPAPIDESALVVDPGAPLAHDADDQGHVDAQDQDGEDQHQ